jgi:hypothetical protein
MQGILATQSFRKPQVWRKALIQGGWAGLPAKAPFTDKARPRRTTCQTETVLTS